MPNFDEYASTFTALDADNDGLISADELKALMQTVGETLDDNTAATMIGFIDTDGDGKVNREELIAYLSAR